MWKKVIREIFINKFLELNIGFGENCVIEQVKYFYIYILKFGNSF